MIAAEQLKSDNYSSECWINVYYYRPLNKIYHSHNFSSKIAAMQASFNKAYGVTGKFYKTLYRIHVRMKS